MPTAPVPISSPIPEFVLLQLLATNPSVGFHSLDIDGRVLFANARSVEIFLGPDYLPDNVIGKTLWDLFPKAFADERAAWHREVIAGGKPRLTRSMWEGIRHYVMTVPHAGPHGGVMDRVTCALHRGGSQDLFDWSVEQFGEVFEPCVVTLGPFAKLTKQELVVLALLGKGMSMKEVAQTLHRSVKTVQAHRDAIGQKLNVKDRGELIALVQNAGLSVDDADRLRIDAEMKAHREANQPGEGD